MKQFVRFLLLVTVCFTTPMRSAQTVVSVLTRSGEEDDKFIDLSLEELMKVRVITATKNQQPITKAPATVLVVTAEQIEARHYRSLLDVIQDLPGFVINDFVHTDYRNCISMRGFDNQSKFIILLDGVQVSIATGEVTPIMENYPVHVAQQIEVVYGPGSALYGADAVAGVINIITKKIGPDKAPRIEFSPSIGMYGMKNGTLFGGVTLSEEAKLIFSGQLYAEDLAPLSDIVLDKDRFDFEAQQKGVFPSRFGTVVPKTPFSQAMEYPVSAYNAFVALKFKDFTVSAFANMNQTPSSFPSTGNNAIYNKNVFFRNLLTTVSASYTKQIDDITISSKLSSNAYEISPESNYRNAFVNFEPGYKYGFGTMRGTEQQLIWQADNHLTIIGGINYTLFEVLPKTADLDTKVDVNAPIQGIIQGTRLPNNPGGIADDLYLIKYSNFGTYAQAQWEPLDMLSVTAGARYDYNSRYGPTFNPRLGVILTPTSKSTLKLLYGSSFLAPSPNSAYEHFGSFTSSDSGRTYSSSYWFLPNPHLEPQYMKTIEINLQQFIGKNLSMSFSGYYIWVNNLYNYVSDSGNTNYYNGKYKGWDVGYIEVIINQGKQRNYGITASLDYSYSGQSLSMRAYAALSYVRAEVQTAYTDANLIRQETYAQAIRTTPLSAHIGADFVVGDLSLSPRLTLIGRQAGENFENPLAPDARISIDGYALLTVSADYRLSDNFTVFCTARNALNSKYAHTSGGVSSNSTYMYGTPQQPFGLAGGMKCKL
ncbi:MAG: TonB-dependent receptor [Candidatus Kapaibacterium sp.]